jgi:hypothetical protein
MPALRFAGSASTLDEEMARSKLARSREKERLSCMSVVICLPERNEKGRDASPSRIKTKRERRRQEKLAPGQRRRTRTRG